MRQTVTPYQYKLDLGEGAECQEAYQEYLTYHHLEDNNDRWAMFLKTWAQIQAVQAMLDKAGATIQ